jgi:hypothetical protein
LSGRKILDFIFAIVVFPFVIIFFHSFITEIPTTPLPENFPYIEFLLKMVVVILLLLGDAILFKAALVSDKK